MRGQSDAVWWVDKGDCNLKCHSILVTRQPHVRIRKLKLKDTFADSEGPREGQTGDGACVSEALGLQHATSWFGRHASPLEVPRNRLH